MVRLICSGSPLCVCRCVRRSVRSCFPPAVVSRHRSSWSLLMVGCVGGDGPRRLTGGRLGHTLQCENRTPRFPHTLRCSVRSRDLLCQSGPPRTSCIILRNVGRRRPRFWRRSRQHAKLRVGTGIRRDNSSAMYVIRCIHVATSTAAASRQLTSWSWQQISHRNMCPTASLHPRALRSKVAKSEASCIIAGMVGSDEWCDPLATSQ